MKIGIPKESAQGENRVAVFPDLVKEYLRDKHEVLIQAGAGNAATFPDENYKKAGAQVVDGAKELYGVSDIILKVQPPRINEESGKQEAELIREGAVLVGFLSPFTNIETVKTLASRNITSFSMEMIPRITRAQSMDALSAMATVSGYKAVLLAADRIYKMFPLLMTAAGTIPSANVLVLGAGVAGLQAIATAKRLGARVEAFDPRPAVREQVKSVGAAFIEMEMPKDSETAGGYAKELSAEFLKKEQEAIASRLGKADIVISTAQVFGKKAPILLTADMLKLMKRGSVIVDMAAEQGGNCELTQADKIIEQNNVTIIGLKNLSALLPIDASQLYSRNLLNLFRLLYPKPGAQPDFNDEIIKGCCVTHAGKIFNGLK